MQRRRKRLLDLDAESTQVAQELKRAERAAATAERAAMREWRTEGTELHTLLVIYALTDAAVKPAAGYLWKIERHHRWPNKLKEVLDVLVYRRAWQNWSL